MRASSQDRFGGPEVLTVIETDRPVAGPDEVLVEVKAASVNYGEAHVREGRAAGTRPPFTLGSDLSGVASEVGVNVGRFQPSDEVYGIFFIGTFAEYVAVPASSLAVKPAGVDHVTAAALPVAAQTAMTAVEAAGAAPGRRILIHAAAGGVGHLAVQLAKLRGAYVIATARAAKHDFLRDLGADELVDYQAVDFTEAVQDVDVVFDLIGGEYGPRSLRCLRPGGTLLAATMNPGTNAEQAEALGRHYAWVGVRPDGSQLEQVGKLVEQGLLRVHVDRVYPLEQLAEAHRYSGTGRVRGKVVITI
ncbi:NADP-dependent oxidoreductase [Micromonospora sp. WMMD980]|uniref:NADP-dependent oxidoreductase n=1 Tax=Micromonospora sp. WMMD980 TaxID=3016088 RepID=UPI002416FFDB|nr:NADP-dependent oxidoreductase [Micromonospora sp. WMMD980]MDG4800228.1 NADP-dependent oxidoreductase [Micromonospora sp. WMMD980]